MRLLHTLLLLSLCHNVAGQVIAMESGVPGDFIPDVYYDNTTGLLTVDTDGMDLTAMFVANDSSAFFNGCILCDGDSINQPPPPGHFFSVGYLNGAAQWIRSFPLTGPGPIGVFELAMGPTGLPQSYFTELFDDTATEGLWSVRFITDSSGQFFTNVTITNSFDNRIDFNMDGVVDVSDVDLMTMVGNLEAGVPISPTNFQFDLVSDGFINILDLNDLLTRAAVINGLSSPYKRGDADLNGVVDAADFVTWNQFKFTSNDRWSAGDFTANGIIDARDFISWNQNKFTSSDAVAVPEPVFAIGMFLLLLLAFRPMRSSALLP